MSPGGSQASAGEGLSPCNIGIGIGWKLLPAAGLHYGRAHHGRRVTLWPSHHSRRVDIMAVLTTPLPHGPVEVGLPAPRHLLCRLV